MTYNNISSYEFVGLSKVPQAVRCAARKTVCDPDLEQAGNINVVVPRDPRG